LFFFIVENRRACAGVSKIRTIKTSTHVGETQQQQQQKTQKQTTITTKVNKTRK